MENRFLRLTMALSLSISLALIFATSGQLFAGNRGVFLSVGDSCLTTYKKWKIRTGHWSAFATNNINYKGHVCGIATKSKSKMDAVELALKNCRASENRRPSLGEKNTCFIYDIK